MTAAVRLFVTREIALRARCLPKPRESSEIHRPTLPSSPDCRHIAGMIAVPVTCSVSGLAPVCLGRDMLRTGRWSPVADGRHTRHPALGEVKIVHGSACPLDGFDDWTRFRPSLLGTVDFLPPRWTSTYLEHQVFFLRDYLLGIRVVDFQGLPSRAI